MVEKSLLKRIDALRQKTTGRGCTEAEAIAAAEKAAELMRDYGLTEADLSIEQQSVRRKSEGHSVRDDLWRRLADFTNCGLHPRF